HPHRRRRRRPHSAVPHLVIVAAGLLLPAAMERRRSVRALVVEDDPGISGLVKRVLLRQGFIVECVRDGDEAIELLKEVAYDLLILDMFLPRIGGEFVLDYLEQEQPEYLRRVIVTTASPRHLSSEFLQRICRLLEKPFDIERLILFARECSESDVA
ncbi:MAG: response regulator, partial [Thermoanaerobaculia bacterium]